MIILIILLLLSAAMNAFFIVYLRWLLKKFAPISEGIGDMLSSMTGFSKHLEAIHELETFYGDTTLKNLIHHSKQIVKDVEIYKDIYTLFNEEEDVDLKKIFEREGLYDEEELE